MPDFRLGLFGNSPTFIGAGVGLEFHRSSGSGCLTRLSGGTILLIRFGIQRFLLRRTVALLHCCTIWALNPLGLMFSCRPCDFLLSLTFIVLEGILGNESWTEKRLEKLHTLLAEEI